MLRRSAPRNDKLNSLSMQGKVVVSLTMLVMLALSGLVTACQGQALAGIPSLASDLPVKAEVRWIGSYEQDIQPIFNQYCVPCHGPERASNGLRLNTYEGVLKGTQYGRVIIPGEPGGSTLLRTLYLTPDPRVHMPHGNFHLSRNQIQNITLWIEAGAIGRWEVGSGR